jgi:putative addiction module component (TIGR02574 family)
MGKSAGEILKQALALPPDERVSLASLLIESLDTEVDEDAEEQWREEVRRRLSQLESGLVTTTPWPEVRALLNDQLPK